jgi:hypothetical protein
MTSYTIRSYRVRAYEPVSGDLFDEETYLSDSLSRAILQMKAYLKMLGYNPEIYSYYEGLV